MSISEKPAYNINVDLIRVFACFCVISVHFFMNIGFYEEVMVGNAMLFMATMRNFFMICVPLFMLLTGYLSGHFKYDNKHWKRIIHVFLINLLCTGVCMVFRVAHMAYPLTFRNLVLEVLCFTGAPYGWYVEMHLGLMLLIPFLNAGIQSLSKRDFTVLIFVIIFLICVSTLVFEWDVFDWWTGAYPLMYYFIGAYFAKYTVKFNKKACFVIAMAMTMFVGGMTYLLDYGGPFKWSLYTGYRSAYILVIAVCVFQILLQVNLNSLPAFGVKLIGTIAKYTLPAYLLSYCFDMRFYMKLVAAVPVLEDRLPYYFIMVPAVFICAIAAGLIITKMVNLMNIVLEHTVYKVVFR